MSYYNAPELPINPPEPRLREAFHCVICDEPIYEGEDYYDIPGLGICCTICIDGAKRYDAEAGPDPDEIYESMREED